MTCMKAMGRIENKKRSIKQHWNTELVRKPDKNNVLQTLHTFKKDIFVEILMNMDHIQHENPILHIFTAYGPDLGFKRVINLIKVQDCLTWIIWHNLLMKITSPLQRLLRVILVFCETAISTQKVEVSIRPYL